MIQSIQNNPNGPKWTEDQLRRLTTRHVNRTITYVNEKGEEVAKKVTDKVTFTREAKINTVTGEITYGDWTAKMEIRVRCCNITSR